MKLKIISDGTCSRSEVINAKTGEPVEDVVAVHWKCDARRRDGFAFATIMVRASCEILVDDVRSVQKIKDREDNARS